MFLLGHVDAAVARGPATAAPSRPTTARWGRTLVVPVPRVGSRLAPEASAEAAPGARRRREPAHLPTGLSPGGDRPCIRVDGSGQTATRHMHEDIEDVLIPTADLARRVAELAREVGADYRGKELLLVGIL